MIEVAAATRSHLAVEDGYSASAMAVRARYPRKGNRHNTLRELATTTKQWPQSGLMPLVPTKWRRRYGAVVIGQIGTSTRTANPTHRNDAGYQYARKTPPTPSPWTSMALERQAETISFRATTSPYHHILMWWFSCVA